ncbi:hypothetical protein PAPYR_8896 [Paratrimastix pyriformis]|uniref:GIY-YIG domain-containing protein n=1 Tax=Paratrimastix pyriformis TaxID=342808 RepID=A0ABQ8UF88_9EUKA|nr:hypothetical protein PAPYR_8896 [Paratrimastix pyriformis]
MVPVRPPRPPPHGDTPANPSKAGPLSPTSPAQGPPNHPRRRLGGEGPRSGGPKATTAPTAQTPLPSPHPPRSTRLLLEQGPSGPQTTLRDAAEGAISAATGRYPAVWSNRTAAALGLSKPQAPSQYPLAPLLPAAAQQDSCPAPPRAARGPEPLLELYFPAVSPSAWLQSRPLCASHPRAATAPALPPQQWRARDGASGPRATGRAAPPISLSGRPGHPLAVRASPGRPGPIPSLPPSTLAPVPCSPSTKAAPIAGAPNPATPADLRVAARCLFLPSRLPEPAPTPPPRSSDVCNAELPASAPLWPPGTPTTSGATGGLDAHQDHWHAPVLYFLANRHRHLYIGSTTHLTRRCQHPGADAPAEILHRPNGDCHFRKPVTISAAVSALAPSSPPTRPQRPPPPHLPFSRRRHRREADEPPDPPRRARGSEPRSPQPLSEAEQDALRGAAGLADPEAILATLVSALARRTPARTAPPPKRAKPQVAPGPLRVALRRTHRIAALLRALYLWYATPTIGFALTQVTIACGEIKYEYSLTVSSESREAYRYSGVPLDTNVGLQALVAGTRFSIVVRMRNTDGHTWGDQFKEITSAQLGYDPTPPRPFAVTIASCFVYSPVKNIFYNNFDLESMKNNFDLESMKVLVVAVVGDP